MNLIEQAIKALETQVKEFSKGIENRCNVYIKDIAFHCLKKHATGLVLFHNHPSGTLNFSAQDIELTKQIRECFKTLEIRVLDHVLITGLGTIAESETI